jgi:DNA/RNA-binding domain of Phe-tRNA-synthetase-like protein
MFYVSDAWKMYYPDAHAGVLVMRNVTNPAQHARLDEHKLALEKQLREQYAGQDRAAIARQPILQAYKVYYQRFDKTYHVQLQLESIVLKGKSIPSVAALVEAMFMAEVRNLLLTAGHDLDAVKLPITLDIAKVDDRYRTLRGQEQINKVGDMVIRDGDSILSSIVYGPDERTQITPSTRNVVFTVYAPAGIAELTVQQHLEIIQQNVQIVIPSAQTTLLRVYGV